jgi:hypothetical protein
MNANPDFGARNSFQARYFNIAGDIIANIGHHDQKAFEAIRASTDQSLIGKWAFALIMTKDKSGVREQAIFYPSGKCEVLVEGVVAVNAPTSKGQWVNYMEMVAIADKAKWTGSVRFAPAIRFPWKEGAVECRVEQFLDAKGLAQWILSHDPVRQILFVSNPASTNLPPDADALFALCVAVPA